MRRSGRSPKSAMQLRAAEAAHVGIWDMDYADWGCCRWSDVMEEQYGLPRGTFDGTFEAFIELIHPDDRASVLETIGRGDEDGIRTSSVHAPQRFAQTERCAG